MSSDVVYKEEITYFLRCLLNISGLETRQAESFDKRFSQLINLKSEIEWKKYKASVDLLDDTEYAIISFLFYICIRVSR